MADHLARWQDKFALVTGASAGIGRAIALALAGAGLHVAVAGRNHRRLAAVARAIERRGRRALILEGDLTAGETARENVKRVMTAWGRLHVLVNDAGCSGGDGFVSADPAAMRACFELNVHAAAAAMQEAVAAMQDQRDAAIINISSLAGHRLPLRPGISVAYSASKHALAIMTEGLRRELAQHKAHTKVALISPGVVDTGWHPQHRSRNRVQAYGFAPLQPSDVAQAVLFVLSMPQRVQVSDVLLRAVGQPD